VHVHAVAVPLLLPHPARSTPRTAMFSSRQILPAGPHAPPSVFWLTPLQPDLPISASTMSLLRSFRALARPLAAHPTALPALTQVRGYARAPPSGMGEGEAAIYKMLDEAFPGTRLEVQDVSGESPSGSISGAAIALEWRAAITVEWRAACAALGACNSMLRFPMCFCGLGKLLFALSASLHHHRRSTPPTVFCHPRPAPLLPLLLPLPLPRCISPHRASPLPSAWRLAPLILIFAHTRRLRLVLRHLDILAGVQGPHDGQAAQARQRVPQGDDQGHPRAAGGLDSASTG
jgi:hypothetical protein